MAPLPGNRNLGGQQDDPDWGRRDQEARRDERGRRRSAEEFAGHTQPAGVSRRPVAAYWDARDEERMHRAQADFDYRGTGRWDEQLGGYRYTGRSYPEERYAARSGQGRDYGPRAGGEGYRPRWGDETTGRGYADELSQGYHGPKRAADGRRPDYATGRFRGRGPAGYRRSDERIREDVNDCLTDDPYLDASGIQVKVENCEVTLDGTVNTRSCRRRAESLVEEISGVTHVQNNLRVQNSDRGPSGDAEDPAKSQRTAASGTIASKSETGRRSS